MQSEGGPSDQGLMPSCCVFLDGGNSTPNKTAMQPHRWSEPAEVQ